MNLLPAIADPPDAMLPTLFAAELDAAARSLPRRRNRWPLGRPVLAPRLRNSGAVTWASGSLCGRFERGGRGHDAVPAGPFGGIQCRISGGECLHEGGFRLMTLWNSSYPAADGNLMVG
jgi:hypothetical protein